MTKKRSWLAPALVTTGVLVVGLLLVTLNRGPLADGLQPYKPLTCLWCPQDQTPTLWDTIATALIIVVLLALPGSHLLLLFLTATQLRRMPETPRPRVVLTCPHCAHEIHIGWKACPYCGEKLDHKLKTSAYVD